MCETITLSELENPRWIAGGCLLLGGELIIVESEFIRKGPYSKQLKYNEMLLTRSSGYNIAVKSFSDFLSGKHYLFILKNCGVLEVRDSDLNRIAILTISDEICDNAMILLDERNQRIFINVKRNQIYVVQFRTTSDGLFFIQKVDNLVCIFECVETLINLELSWHTDCESSRDFIAISMLLQEEMSNKYYFQVIKQIQGNCSRKQRWTTLIDKTYLELTISRGNLANIQRKDVTFRAVPNIGFFLFSLHETFFFVLPESAGHTVGGKQIIGFERFDCISESDDLPTNDRTILHPYVSLEQNVSYLQFTIFTTSNFVIHIKFDLIHEDDEDFVYHWNDCISTKYTFSSIGLAQANSGITNVLSLGNSQCLLWIIDYGLAFFDTKVLEISHVIRICSRTNFYSGSVGPNFSKNIICGGSRNNTGFLESYWAGYDDYFSIKGTQTSLSEITTIWSSEGGVWWLSEDRNLYYNGIFKKEATNVLYISKNNTIVEDDSVIVVADIEDDPNSNYCYIKNDGLISWTDNGASKEIRGFRSSNLVKYSLACVQDMEHSRWTVMAIGCVFTVFKDEVVVVESMDLSNEMTAISTLFINKDVSPKLVLIGDINGNFFTFDIKSRSIISKTKLGYGKVFFCGIPSSKDVLVYTHEDLFLLRNENQQLIRINNSFSILKICFCNRATAHILTDTFNIVSCIIPQQHPKIEVIRDSIISSTHFHTKFIELPFSTRYVITASFHLEYSPEYKRDIFSSEIQLQDLLYKETKFRYSITEKYPQAIISDIIAVPYLIEPNFDPKATGQKSYAKRLTFDKCFIVSLDYETAEDENDLENLLLFSIDDGVIDFHLGIKTGFGITSLLNFYEYQFLVAGNLLQIFNIDYSVKDNIFKVESMSNKVSLSGFAKGLLLLSNSCEKDSKQEHMEHSASTQPSHRIGVVNILKGLSEFEVLNYYGDLSVASRRNYRAQIKPIPNGGRVTDGIEWVHHQLLTNAAFAVDGKNKWLVLSWTNNIVSIHLLSATGIKNSVEFKLSSTVTSLQPLFCNKEFQNHGEIAVRFVITTDHGGWYLLDSVTNSYLKSQIIKIPEEELEEQRQFIGYNENGISLIDFRLLSDCDSNLFKVNLQRFSFLLNDKPDIN